MDSPFITNQSLEKALGRKDRKEGDCRTRYHFSLSSYPIVHGDYERSL